MNPTTMGGSVRNKESHRDHARRKLCRRSLAGPGGNAHRAAQRIHRGTGRRHRHRPDRHGPGAGSRQIGRRTGTAGDAVPRAGLGAQGARGASERQTRTVLCHLGVDRGHQAGFVRRHRRRHRGVVHLRQQGPPGTAELDGAGRRPGGTAGQDGSVRRPAHLHPAPRGCPADQRVQLPGLGDAGEARAGLPGRGADRGQTRVAGVLPGRGRGQGDHRLRVAARRQPAAGRRRVQGSAGPAVRAGHRRVHRVRLDRGAAALAPLGDGTRGAVQLGGRLAELLRAGRRCRSQDRRNSTCTSGNWSPR